jgi:hypothetical protein
MVKFRLWRKRPRWHQEEYLGVREGIIQAAQALDMAGYHAANTNDKEALVATAHGWMRLVEEIAGLPHHLGEDEDNDPEHKTGFRGHTELTTETERAEDDED